MAQRQRSLPTMTPSGVAIAAGAVMLGAGGIALGYTVLVAIAVAGLAAVVAGFLIAAGIPHLKVLREISPERVERGNPAMGLVQVRNVGRGRSRSCDAIEKIGDSSIAIALPSLKPRRSTSVPYRLPTARRGAVAVGPFSIERSDPLGLWRSSRIVGDSTLLLVQPKIHRIRPRPAGRAAHLDGPVSETAPRGTLTFHTLREYVPGDDIRRVHWKTTARTGTMMVREHVDTSQPSTVIVLDTVADHYVGDAFEDAVDIVASVVSASQARGFPIRFVTTDGTTMLVRTGQRGQAMVDYLTAVQPGAEGSWQQAAVSALGGRDHDVVILVCGAVTAADLAVMTAMTRRFGFKALATVRPPADETTDGSTEVSPTVRWPVGTHLDGATAEQVLASWRR